MKICFITLHWANNYGAALQTYAMNEVLKRGGEEDGPLGTELASNLNKVGGNPDLLRDAGIG